MTLLAALVAWVAGGSAWARVPDPPIRIPLQPLGYQSIVQDFLLQGNSMLTVDFVDSDHLLVTFGVRRLMTREVDPPPDDDDRMVEAVLLELPSGKLLARTEWRFHDRLQYLWRLGHGRFLLRERGRLSVLAPLGAANRDDPFRRTPLLRVDRHIVLIQVSPEGDLLTVETTKPPAGQGAAENGMGGAFDPLDPAPVQSNFYRLESAGDAGDNVQPVVAGFVRTRSPIAVPMTAAGFLELQDGGKGTWLFNFDEHAGKVDELLAFDTSCFPRSTFVGLSEFVVFGCRGNEERQDLAAFNLKGDEMWQDNFTDVHIAPTFSFAPAAGRFALGRTIVNGVVDPESVSVGAVTGQDVRVYQSYNGKLLFRSDVSPVERAGQNFALSPDGLRVALVRETPVQHKATKDEEGYTDREAAVEVYALPALSDKDQAAVKAAAATAPADTGARIDVSLERLAAKPAGNRGGSAAVPVAVQPPAPVAPDAGGLPNAPAANTGAEAGATEAATGAGTTDAAGAAAAGDPDSDAPRTPPTLYGPGEKPGDKKPQ
jgi:hypothetical protein